MAHNIRIIEENKLRKHLLHQNNVSYCDWHLICINEKKCTLKVIPA